MSTKIIQAIEAELGQIEVALEKEAAARRELEAALMEVVAFLPPSGNGGNGAGAVDVDDLLALEDEDDEGGDDLLDLDGDPLALEDEEADDDEGDDIWAAILEEEGGPL
jgi:hypothetical protein